MKRHLQDFDFGGLFVDELGWNRYRESFEVNGRSRRFGLHAVAEKRGVAVLVCEIDDGNMPDRAERLHIDREATKVIHNHLIIFADRARPLQVWLLGQRSSGRSTPPPEWRVGRHQSGRALLQRLTRITYSLEQEEDLTHTSVTADLVRAFDVEPVVRRFYNEFRKQQVEFAKRIDGIPSDPVPPETPPDDARRDVTKRWYVSVILNRLMFICFLQEHGLLDGRRRYLQDKLAESQRQAPDQFFRRYLLRLFFDGFAKPEAERSDETNRLLGRIPYLNGGLFLPHPIEERFGDDIRIPDAAFEKLLTFFADWRWYLDEHETSDGTEIDPEILGYIYEKYINQKQMGAYYTKEDITEYISKNTIIPFLFDAARPRCPIAFEAGGPVWRLLRDDPERYVYAAVRHGTELELPDYIAEGLDSVPDRGRWNEPAPEEYALPTEIWREVVARRQRYEEVKGKLAAGEVTSINDLITYNLDIREFAEDVIRGCEGPDLLAAFWDAIERVTVLDPTCGSGAFLFAALNILEPLYEACLDRMEFFLDEWGEAGRREHPIYTRRFEQVLQHIYKRPSREYFVLKSMVVNNLFGVDIMDEAVEICKLRLFLKLVAQVEPDPNKENQGIEPLPDIDFNIQAGNTLVGFARLEEVEQALTEASGQMALIVSDEQEETLQRIRDQAADLQNLFDLFRKMQTEQGMAPADFAEAKAALRERLDALNGELDRYLASVYRVDLSDDGAFTDWRASHQPFHWCVEFYRMMEAGGFDVIIGNPPYVRTADVTNYTARGYSTADCGDLYAMVMERSVVLGAAHGRLGFIIPMSGFALDGFKSLQELYLSQIAPVHLSHWSGDAHPSRLFEGVDKRLHIVLGAKANANKPQLLSTAYHKWYAVERPHLFSVAPLYTTIPGEQPVALSSDCPPKLGEAVEVSVARKLQRACGLRPLGSLATPRGRHKIFYTRKVSFFLQFLDREPGVWGPDGGQRSPSELKVLCFNDLQIRDLCLAALSSNLFYWYYIVSSDCRNLNKREIDRFPVPQVDTSTQIALSELVADLMLDYQENSFTRTVDYRAVGVVTVQYFDFRRSKPLIDRIDRLLGPAYGLNGEEVEFVVNYMVKYRQGLDQS